MAEAVEEQVGAQPAEPARSAAPPSRRRRAYGGRFLVAYVILACVAGAAIAAGIALFLRDAPPQEETWSSWRPTGEQATYPEQIAEYVGMRYRLPSKNQLVAVLAGPPVVPVSPETSLEVTHVAVTKPSGDIEVHEIGEQGVIYRFCGLGDNCAIAEGKASEERHRLLRREALELALYTFKYVDETESVVVQLPPPPNSAQQSGALFFRRDDVESQLDVPLIETLERSDPPSVVARISPIESVKIDRLTQPRLFRFDYRLTPDATGFVLLLSRNPA